MTPEFDEKITDLALESVVGGKSKNNDSSIEKFVSHFGANTLDKLASAYEMYRSLGYEAEGKVRNLFEPGEGDSDLGQAGDHYNQMGIDGLNAKLDSHNSETVSVLGDIASAGLLAIGGAAVGTGLGYVGESVYGAGESVYGAVPSLFDTDTTIENIATQNEALNTLVSQLSENAQNYHGKLQYIDGSKPIEENAADIGQALSTVKFHEMIDDVTVARLKEQMNEKEPGSGDMVINAITRHADVIKDRSSELIPDSGDARYVAETMEQLIKDPSLAGELHLPSDVGKTLFYLKAQTVMLFSGMFELSEEARAQTQDGLGSALSHHGGSSYGFGSSINTHPAEVWDPGVDEVTNRQETNFKTLDRIIGRSGGTQELGGINEVLWNKNMSGVTKELGTMVDLVAKRDGTYAQDVQANLHDRIDPLITKNLSHQVDDLVKHTGSMFHDYLKEKNNGEVPTPDQIKSEIVRQAEAGNFGLLRVGIEDLDWHDRQTIIGDARQIQFHYQQLKADLLDRELADGNTKFTRVQEQPDPLEGQNLGHMIFHDPEAVTWQDKAKTSEFRFKGFDVQKILEDNHEMPTSEHVPLNEVIREYGTQIDRLQARGVIGITDATKIYTALQHIGKDNFEVARFKIDSERMAPKGNARELEDGMKHHDLVSREIVLKSPTFESELPKLSKLQQLTANDWTDSYSRDVMPWRGIMAETYDNPAAMAGFYIGGVGGMMADILDSVQANEGEVVPTSPGMDHRESNLANVSATHEALVRALNDPEESHDNTSILNHIQDFARSKTAMQRADHDEETDKLSTQTELNVYNTVDELIHGKLTVSEVPGVPESFVDKLQQEHASALDAISLQTRIATTAAIDDLTKDPDSKLASLLESFGKGSTSEEKKISGAESLLSGEHHLTTEQQHLVGALKVSRENYMSEMPETALIAGMEENQQKVPIGIGLKPEQLAGIARVDRLLQDQDTQLEHLHLSPDEAAQYYSQMNLRVLAEMDSAGQHIPKALAPLLAHISSEHTVKNPVAESEILGYLASTAIAGDLHKHGAAEEEKFLQQFFDTRKQVLAADPPPQH